MKNTHVSLHKCQVAAVGTKIPFLVVVVVVRAYRCVLTSKAFFVVVADVDFHWYRTLCSVLLLLQSVLCIVVLTTSPFIFSGQEYENGKEETHLRTTVSSTSPIQITTPITLARRMQHQHLRPGLVLPSAIPPSTIPLFFHSARVVRTLPFPSVISVVDSDACVFTHLHLPFLFFLIVGMILQNACSIGGVNCLRLIHEHTATALAYGIYKSAKGEFSEKVTEPQP